jgi:hypothetical protein
MHGPPKPQPWTCGLTGSEDFIGSGGAVPRRTLRIRIFSTFHSWCEFIMNALIFDALSVGPDRLSISAMTANARAFRASASVQVG